jgi:leucyl aminopeptidase
MISMKNDMGGAAAVLGAMRTIAMLGVPRRVIGLLACTENMPGGRAYRPSDVVRAGNGTTIEIVSTDAEGRLALADALVHAARYEPAAVIDVATLTGSAVRALGEGVAAAMFSNDDRVAARLEAAADTTHERVWRLPLFEDYRRKIDSDVADMKNSGGAKGGVGTSAVFLQEFVSAPWAHVDIAGVVVASRAKGYGAKGATGFGVRLLAEAVRTWDT